MSDYDGDLLDLIPRQGKSPAQRFLEFHAKNPHVYGHLLRFTREAKDAGLTKVGLSTLLGRVRWYLQIEVDTTDSYRLNDHYGPFYARTIMYVNLDLDGMFDLREARADDDPAAWLPTAARIALNGATL